MAITRKKKEAPPTPAPEEPKTITRRVRTPVEKPFEELQHAVLIVEEEGEKVEVPAFCFECGLSQRIASGNPITAGSAICAAGHCGAASLVQKARDAKFPAKKADEPAADDPLFVSNNATDPSKHADFNSIVESIYSVDIAADYARLEKGLVVTEDEGDRGTLRKYLNQAEDNARNAHRLYLAAKLQAEIIKREDEPVVAAMRREATAMLQAEKDDGKRNKAITDTDVSGLAVRRGLACRDDSS